MSIEYAMKVGQKTALFVCAAAIAISPPNVAFADPVKTANGTIEGTTEPSGIRAFRGIPFAAPP